MRDDKGRFIKGSESVNDRKSEWFEEPPVVEQTPDEKLLNVSTLPQGSPWSKVGAYLPIVVGLLLLGALLFFLKPFASTAVVSTENTSVISDLQSQLLSKSDALLECNNHLLNVSGSVSTNLDRECRSDLVVSQSSLNQVQSQLDSCNVGLISLNSTYVQCNSNLTNQTLLQSQVDALNDSLNIVYYAFHNLSSNWTLLNSSYWNCSWSLNNTNFSNASLVANLSGCNFSYALANLTILSLNTSYNSLLGNYSTLNSGFLQVQGLNSYLLSNLTCFKCWKELNQTRYFWNATSRELFCTDISWMTIPVDMGAC